MFTELGLMFSKINSMEPTLTFQILCFHASLKLLKIVTYPFLTQQCKEVICDFV